MNLVELDHSREDGELDVEDLAENTVFHQELKNFDESLDFWMQRLNEALL